MTAQFQIKTPNLHAPVANAALFLDLDGTLARIEPRPSDVVPSAERTALLSRAYRALGGRMAVVSGRSIEDVDRITERRSPCVAGIHGLSRRLADGSIISVAPHPALGDANDAFRAVARAQKGLLVEQKDLSVALHYRNAPGAAEAVLELARRLEKDTGLVLQAGDMVAELKTPGPDKGDAVRAFMTERLFAGAIPIFIGDDLTDEAGFSAAAELGGFGILVGPDRQTHATARLDGPADVLTWISGSLDIGAFIIEAQS